MDLPNSTSDLGTLGETFVADWLQAQGAIVLARQWSCRSGELDLVVKTADSTIVFVEVKTRSRGNWDNDGALAITPTKQRKLVIAAQLFLQKHPELAGFPCRFDVALVRYTKICYTEKRGNPPTLATSPHLTKNQFSLQNYIDNAFC
ncbi:YraN family protein [Leptolyngbya sp. AN03gr2]|uniref:YraN family protein n=1 Tax=unclassified Leptolyngbya TaxID=2650499 RepID=UPI003D31EC03